MVTWWASRAAVGDVLQRSCSRRVLLVDLDPQASLTEWLTTPDDPVEHGVEDLLIDQIDDVQKVLVALRPGLDLLPATNGLLDAAAALERRSLGPDITAQHDGHPRRFGKRTRHAGSLAASP